MGLTSVMCAVIGPTDCIRKSDELPNKAILEVSIRSTPFASSSGDRRTMNPNTDRKIREQCTLIQNAISASLLLNLYPKSRIILDFTILSDDGGRLCAAINAATCALVDAGLPMKDLVCSCSAGLVTTITGPTNVVNNDDAKNTTTNGLEDVAILDLNQKEMSTYQYESSAVYLPCATMPQRNTIVLAQCESRLHSVTVLERVLEAAMDGCYQVFIIMDAYLRERTAKLIAAQAGNAVVEQVLF
jgi:exosome complex component RRP41